MITTASTATALTAIIIFFFLVNAIFWGSFDQALKFLIENEVIGFQQGCPFETGTLE